MKSSNATTLATLRKREGKRKSIVGQDNLPGTASITKVLLPDSKYRTCSVVSATCGVMAAFRRITTNTSSFEKLSFVYEIQIELVRSVIYIETDVFGSPLFWLVGPWTISGKTG